MIKALSRRGILLGTPRTAMLPALYAATSPDARGELFYGPQGPGNLGGAPGQQALWRPLRSAEDAARVWQISQELTEVRFPDS